MLDKTLAVISMVMFIGFMIIVISFIGRIDLAVVVVIVIAMAIFDFWREFRNQASRNNRQKLSK